MIEVIDSHSVARSTEHRVTLVSKQRAEMRFLVLRSAAGRCTRLASEPQCPRFRILQRGISEEHGGWVRNERVDKIRQRERLAKV